MRKLILIIALTMVPLGIWTAGCRNDQQAAFPDTPEMKSLAGPSADKKASEVATAPMIPAKPIDREILHYPDNGTLARVQAVRDRANRYASEQAGANHGLFTLPEENNYTASAPAARRNAGNESESVAAMIPAPSAREFWSRPVAERNSDSARSRRGLPDDVSAMAGPARREDGGAVLPPPPTRAPARGAQNELILPPDDLPGVFMVGEADAPPDAPPSARGFFGMLRNDRGDARSAPPSLSRAATPMRSSQLRNRAPSVERRLLSAAGARPKAELTQSAPMLLNIENLVGVDAALPAAPAVPAAPERRELAEQRFAVSAPEAFPPIAPGARIVSSEGMDFEPLPEPIPLAQYNTMVMNELAAGVPGVKGVSRSEARRPVSTPAPAPAAKKTAALSAPVLPLPAALLRGNGKPAPKAVPAAAPAIPELTEAKTAAKSPAKMPGAEQFAKVEKALAPLPVLPAPTKPRQKKVVVAMPAPVPVAQSAPEALPGFSPEAMDEAFAELSRDGSGFFKTDTDFWDPAAKAQRKTESTALPALPELTEPGAPEELMIPMPPPLLEEPQKIVLQPIRKSRDAGLEKIDSATDVPPMKY